MSVTSPPVVPVGVKTVDVEGPAVTLPMSPLSTLHAAWAALPLRVALKVAVGVDVPLGTVSVVSALGVTEKMFAASMLLFRTVPPESLPESFVCPASRTLPSAPESGKDELSSEEPHAIAVAVATQAARNT